MGVRERVALIPTIILLSMVMSSHCLPNLRSSKNIRNKSTQTAVNLNTTNFKLKQKGNSRNVNLAPTRKTTLKQEQLLEKFNFPQIEYPLASTPSTPKKFTQDQIIPIKTTQMSKNPISVKKSQRKQQRNFSQVTKHNKTIESVPEKTTPNEFASAPTYRDVGAFPDVEYPLNVKDMWQPNFWNIHSKFNNEVTNSRSQIKETNIKSLHERTKNYRKSLTTTLNKNKNPIHSISKTKENIDPLQNLKTDDSKYVTINKRSHDVDATILKDSNIDVDNIYKPATPMPSLQEEDKSTSNQGILEKIASLLQNILGLNNYSKYEDPPSNTNEIATLEEILSLEPTISHRCDNSTLDTSIMTLLDDISGSNKSGAIVIKTTSVDKISTHNISTELPTSKTQSNVLHLSEIPHSHSQKCSKTDNASSTDLNTIINVSDSSNLSQRGSTNNNTKFISDNNNTSASTQCNKYDVIELDKVNCNNNSQTTRDINIDNRYNISESLLNEDEECTTDVYPDNNGIWYSALSTVPPQIITLNDPTWSSSSVIDQLKSDIEMDDLEEYYIAVH